MKERINEQPVKKFKSFEKLPPELAEELKQKLIAGDRKSYEEDERKPEYTPEQLKAIVDGFVTFNNAVRNGLPDDLYGMFSRQLDSAIAIRAHREMLVWLAHEGGDQPKQRARQFAERVEAEVDERADWDEEKFHEEKFLKR